MGTLGYPLLIGIIILLFDFGLVLGFFGLLHGGDAQED